MCPDGIEQFVSTPELHSENSIGSDPTCGSSWVYLLGGADEIGVVRIEVTEAGAGSDLTRVLRTVERVCVRQQNL